eukprot:TRINITY_DN4656_c0_g1_i1.p1 TRINITY_DN4656_c0_g1~~TRINITY_DN4656_c0_g1_i1.p1  ORF type:complete len:659 (+),score=270.56 TRINITY_DN4656_c0_g1_i1:46-2022(+)
MKRLARASGAFLAAPAASRRAWYHGAVQRAEVQDPVPENLDTTPAEKKLNPVPRPEDVRFDPARNLEEYHGLNGGQILEKKLREYGVTHIFGFTGGAILPVTDAFYGSPIKFINNASEQCSGHMAEGFAKTGGGLTTGIAMATSGPGVTNLVTALQDALTDSVPIIAFVGQVPTGSVGTDAFQECPTIDITRPCTKWNYQVRRIEEFPDVIDKAFYMAHSGKKGPVLVDLPKDIMLKLLDNDTGYKNVDHIVPTLVPHRYKKIPKLDVIAELINGAKKPVIIAGQGANDAMDEVREMMDKFGIPTTTTLHAMGLVDEMHPMALKMLGMHGAAYANFTVQEADLIIALGYRFDDRTTGNLQHYAREAKKAERHNKGGIIQIEIEHKQIGKVVKPTHHVLGDVKETLTQLLPLLNNDTDRSDWHKEVQGYKAKYPLKWRPCEDPEQIKVQEVIEEMNTYLLETDKAKDVVWSTGVGNHQMMCAQFVTWRWPRRMLSSGSLGTMGVGVPYATGGQIARPDLMAICVDGDGSFMMTANDIGTMAKYGIPVKIALMNDFRQQMVHIWQTIYFEQRYLITENVNPDFVKMGEAFGIKAMRVDTKSGLKAGIKEFIDYKGPVICDFRVQPDMCTPMVAPGAALDDMILEPEEIMRLEANPNNVPG